MGHGFLENGNIERGDVKKRLEHAMESRKKG